MDSLQIHFLYFEVAGLCLVFIEEQVFCELLNIDMLDLGGIDIFCTSINQIGQIIKPHQNLVPCHREYSVSYSLC